MKMKRKIISLMIITSALAGLLPGAAFAEGDAKLRTFTYEENFDSIEDGKLPEGWTLYRNKSGTASKTIKAETRNGALEITDNNYYSKGYLIFDLPGLVDVYSKNLTMECDITLGNSLGIEGDNRDTDCVGFAYAFDESKIDAAKITDTDGVKVVDGGVPDKASFRVKMFTNKGESTTKQMLLNEKYNKNSEYRSLTVTSDENKINTAGTEQKMKLKIEVIDINYQPQIYLNGNKVENSLGTRVDPDRTSGKIGLYINDTAVTIDNVKITATGMVLDTIKTYKAGFRTLNGKYADADDAKADVEVSECDCFGNPERDVTGEAQIEASEDIDGNITINVSYGDFTKTLTTKVADFDLISVTDGKAVLDGSTMTVTMNVSNNSKKAASAVLIACPMKSGVPFGKGIYYKTVTLEPKEENKETEFTFEYEGDDMPDSYKLYFIDSITNGFRVTAPMINVNN